MTDSIILFGVMGRHAPILTEWYWMQLVRAGMSVRPVSTPVWNSGTSAFLFLDHVGSICATAREVVVAPLEAEVLISLGIAGKVSLRSEATLKDPSKKHQQFDTDPVNHHWRHRWRFDLPTGFITTFFEFACIRGQRPALMLCKSEHQA